MSCNRNKAGSKGRLCPAATRRVPPSGQGNGMVREMKRKVILGQSIFFYHSGPKYLRWIGKRLPVLYSRILVTQCPTGNLDPLPTFGPSFGLVLFLMIHLKVEPKCNVHKCQGNKTGKRYPACSQRTDLNFPEMPPNNI